MDRQAAGREAGGLPGAGGKAPAEHASIIFDSHVAREAIGGFAGLAIGTQIATLDGMIPVEFLNPGERVITRRGRALLRAVTALPVSGRFVQIAQGALGHDRPGAPLVLGAATRLLIRDWRAQALYGKAQALVPAGRLVDGQYVTEFRPDTPRGKLRLYVLHFDAPEVVYAEGVEIGCAPLKVQTQS